MVPFLASIVLPIPDDLPPRSVVPDDLCTFYDPNLEMTVVRGTGRPAIDEPVLPLACTGTLVTRAPTDRTRDEPTDRF